MTRIVSASIIQTACCSAVRSPTVGAGRYGFSFEAITRSWCRSCSRRAQTGGGGSACMRVRRERRERRVLAGLVMTTIGSATQ